MTAVYPTLQKMRQEMLRIIKKVEAIERVSPSPIDRANVEVKMRNGVVLTVPYAVVNYEFKKHYGINLRNSALWSRYSTTEVDLTAFGAYRLAPEGHVDAELEAAVRERLPKSVHIFRLEKFHVLLHECHFTFYVKVGGEEVYRDVKFSLTKEEFDGVYYQHRRTVRKNMKTLLITAVAILLRNMQDYFEF